jgi:hypothetical protein
MWAPVGTIGVHLPASDDEGPRIASESGGPPARQLMDNSPLLTIFPKLSDVGDSDPRDLMIGLSSWVIADGNYPHFKRGDRVSFALAFYAPDPLRIPEDCLSINPPGADRVSLRQLEGSYYLVTAKVTHILDYDGWWVIDAGIPMYRAGMPTNDITVGCWLRGTINLGVDPFDYFERLSRYYVAPPLIYDWDVKKIGLETTPIMLNRVA